MSVKELLSNATQEQKEKALKCQTVEELLEFAKGEGVKMSAEEAAELFANVKGKTGELSDDDLDNVAGGKGQEGVKCPHCGALESFIIPDPSAHLVKRQLYRCHACNRVWEILE